MDCMEAAYEVLRAAGKPLHYCEISERVLAQGLWRTQGKTPEKTIAARIYVDIKKRGEGSRFRSTGRGVFSANETGVSSEEARSTVKTVTRSSRSQTLSFLDAAERILKQFGGRKPMHYGDLTRRGLESGLITTKGKTPDATMRAQLETEIQRKTRRGEQPRFTKHGRGLYGLSRWSGRGLALQIEQHNKQIRKKLHTGLFDGSPEDFESLVGRLLTAIGFEDVSVTHLSRDGGIDVRGTLVVGDVIRTRMAVQVKRWRKNVQAPTVQQMRGSLGAHEQGLVITTSDFSRGAREEAERVDATPVALMNGEQLVKLLVENGIGVRRTSHDLIELGEVEEDT